MCPSWSVFRPFQCVCLVLHQVAGRGIRVQAAPLLLHALLQGPTRCAGGGKAAILGSAAWGGRDLYLSTYLLGRWIDINVCVLGNDSQQQPVLPWPMGCSPWWNVWNGWAAGDELTSRVPYAAYSIATSHVSLVVSLRTAPLALGLTDDSIISYKYFRWLSAGCPLHVG